MINWIYFPQNKKIEKHLAGIISAFETKKKEIDSETHTDSENLKSDEVLGIVSPELEKAGYSVEKSKKAEDKIRVPVLFGLNGKVNLQFEVDAYSENNGTVIEIEAGRGVTNYQFLKDFYEACMMHNVRYLCLAVKNQYRGSNDFQKVRAFFETLFASNRMAMPFRRSLLLINSLRAYHQSLYETAKKEMLLEVKSLSCNLFQRMTSAWSHPFFVANRRQFTTFQGSSL